MADGLKFIVKPRGVQDNLSDAKVDSYNPVQRLLCGPSLDPKLLKGVLRMYISPIMQRDERIGHSFDVEKAEVHYLLFYAADYCRLKAIKDDPAKTKSKNVVPPLTRVTEAEVFKRFSSRMEVGVLTPALAVQTFSVRRNPY